jgi:hypothetical protein
LEEPECPKEFPNLEVRIDYIWPNPFNSSTTITFSLSDQSAKSAVKLSIQDISGREVARFVRDATFDAPIAGDPPFFSPPASRGEKNTPWSGTHPPSPPEFISSVFNLTVNWQ